MFKKALIIIGLYLLSVTIQIIAMSQLPEINEDIFTIIMLFSVIPITVLLLYIKKIIPCKYNIIRQFLKFCALISIIIFGIFLILTLFTNVQLCQGFYELDNIIN